MTVASRVAMIAGIYVAMFSALIYLAFKAHDWLAGAILLGAVILMVGWQLVHVKRLVSMAAWAAVTRRLVLGWAVILVVLNWRLGSWLAVYRGVDVAVIHGLLPVWVMPVATLTLLVWIGAVMAMTRVVQDGNGAAGR